MAVGDIHACPEPLTELLQLAESYPEHKLVFLGDYIDRGPDANAVISILSELDAIFIRGNHEQTLLDAMHTLEQEADEEWFLNWKNISRESYLWIKDQTRASFVTEDYVFSHAGMDPDKQLEEQTDDDFFWSYHEEEYKNESRTMVHGHIAGDSVRIVGNNINVDTGCGQDGFLSAIVLPEKKILTSRTRGFRTQH